MTIEPEIQITDAQITAKAKEIAKKELLDDLRKKADRKAKSDAEKQKKAEAKAKADALNTERQEYLKNLPQYFSDRLEKSILKVMERYMDTKELRFLDRLYKLAVIKREILGGKS